jgi:hypothetical protein
MQVKFYSAIAQLLQAMVNCQDKANTCEHPDASSKHWRDMAEHHRDSIQALMKAHAPSGSGFDSGTKLDMDKSTVDKLVFNADFHHMDDNGFYCGWTEHQVIITASLISDYSIRVTGRDKRQIKDFISDTFHHLGSIEIDPYARIQTTVGA